jgi:hypothetical protein
MKMAVTTGKTLNLIAYDATQTESRPRIYLILEIAADLELHIRYVLKKGKLVLHTLG